MLEITDASVNIPTLWDRIRAWCGQRIANYTMKGYREAMETLKREPGTPHLSAALLPSVGRVVLYVNADGCTWPAIVSEIDPLNPYTLNLTMFPTTGPAVVTSANFDEHGRVGSWRWPEFNVRRGS